MMSFVRKVCLIGDFGVGKTSLVSRVVRNTFSEKYLTTVGAKVDSKVIDLSDDKTLRIVLWDIAGGSDLNEMRTGYLLGVQGILLVADGTRASTAASALSIYRQVEEHLGQSIPSVLMLNKNDLSGSWEIPHAEMAELRKTIPTFSVSAKSGKGVELAMTALAQDLVK